MYLGKHKDNEKDLFNIPFTACPNGKNSPISNDAKETSLLCPSQLCPLYHNRHFPEKKTGTRRIIADKTVYLRASNSLLVMLSIYLVYL